MFADSLTPPPGIATWLACLAFIMVMLNQGWRLVGNFRGKPSAPEVQQEAHRTFALRTDVDARFVQLTQRMTELETDTEERDRSLRAELASMERRLNDAGEHRHENFNARLLEQLRAVSRLEGRIDQRPG
jgi:hypothetical protein